MGWSDDPKSSYYNRQILIRKNYKFSYEKLYRKDHKYDFVIPIKYNYKKTVKNKGSAIFLHISNKKPTAGCVAISKKNFLKILPLINNKTKISIN